VKIVIPTIKTMVNKPKTIRKLCKENLYFHFKWNFRRVQW